MAIVRSIKKGNNPTPRSSKTPEIIIIFSTLRVPDNTAHNNRYTPPIRKTENKRELKEKHKACPIPHNACDIEDEVKKLFLIFSTLFGRLDLYEFIFSASSSIVGLSYMSAKFKKLIS